MPKPLSTIHREGNGHVEPGVLPGLPGKRTCGLAECLRKLTRDTQPEARPSTGLKRVKIVYMVPPRLAEEAYQGKIGEFLRAVAPHTEATDPAVLAHLLPAIGTLIGPGPTIYAGSPQPPRVNCVVVGETNSGRKGTAANPVEELMNVVDGHFWKTQRVGGLSSGEGLIGYVADEKGEDGEVIPIEKRAYILEEEFCRVLANMKREGNILSHVIRQAFDNGCLSTLTVKRRHASGAHISIVAHVTPDELEKRFDGIEAANGFGNRFLWWRVASDKLIPRPRPIPGKVFQDFAPRLRAVMGLKAQQVEMETEAEDYWTEQYSNLRQDRPGEAGAITSRGPAIVLRLALIYAIVDDPRKPMIRLDHLRAALAVWRYNCESADMLFDSKTGDKLGDRLYHLIRSSGSMSLKEFHRHLSNEQKRSLEPTLRMMEQMKIIRSETIPTKGRPKTRSRPRAAPRQCGSWPMSYRNYLNSRIFVAKWKLADEL